MGDIQGGGEVVRAALYDGDERKGQYLWLGPESGTEADMLRELKDLWRRRGRLVRKGPGPGGRIGFQFDLSGATTPGLRRSERRGG